MTAINEKYLINSFIVNLSKNISIFNPAISKHQIRVAFITSEINHLLNLSKDEIKDLFIAGLVHDIGAFSDDAKESLIRGSEKNLEYHSVKGAEIIDTIYPGLISSMVRYHHASLEVLKGLEPGLAFKTGVLKLADFIDRSNVRFHAKESWGDYLLEDLKKDVGVEFTAEHYKLAEGLLANSDMREKLTCINKKGIDCIDELIEFVDAGSSENIIKLSQIIMTLVDYKSDHTCRHSFRVASTAYKMAQLLNLSNDEAIKLLIAGNFHDLGKLAIPSSILDKPGPLNNEEFGIMKTHVEITYNFLLSMGFEYLAPYAGHHHERIDGSGYPLGLKGEEISFEARILAVADVFAALIEERPYRPAMSDEQVFEQMIFLSDSQKLDPSMVRLLLNNYDQFKKYASETNRKFNNYLVSKLTDE